MSVFNPPPGEEFASIRTTRSIGLFTAMVVIEEIGSDELEITQHPVQQGANITDNAYSKPATVDIKFLFNASVQPLRETYQQLLDLMNSREPFDVVTGKRVYKNMLIKSLRQDTAKETENILSLSASLQQIIIVDVQVTSVPPRSRQANAGKTGATENAGQKNAQTQNDDQTSKRKSALKQLFGN